jgi:hypothetical protein
MALENFFKKLNPSFMWHFFFIHSICILLDVHHLMIFLHFSNGVVKGKGKGKGKGKAAPLQAWSGPEGSRKSRFPDYMTTA